MVGNPKIVWETRNSITSALVGEFWIELSCYVKWLKYDVVQALKIKSAALNSMSWEHL